MKFDLQDLLLVVGEVSFIGGIAVWSKPAAAIMFGCSCFLGVLLIERARKAKSGTPH